MCYWSDCTSAMMLVLSVTSSRTIVTTGSVMSQCLPGGSIWPGFLLICCGVALSLVFPLILGRRVDTHGLSSR